MSALSRDPLSLALAGGLLVGICFIFPAAFPLAIAGLALIVHAVRLARTGARAALAAFISGLAINLLALAAIFWHSMPLDWLGVPDLLPQLIGISFTWVYSAASLAAGTALFGVLAWRFKSPGGWYDLLLFPSAWVIGEVTGALVFNFTTWGPGSILGAHFSLGWVGYVLAGDAALRQAASIGSVYAISFIGVLLAVLLVRAGALSGRVRTHALILLGMIVLAWGTVHAAFAMLQPGVPLDASRIRIAVISRYEPPMLTLSLEEQQGFLERASALLPGLRDIDLLVFPENTAFLRSLAADEWRPVITRTLSEIGRGGAVPLVIDSEDLQMDGEPIKSRVAYWQGQGSVSYGYKQFLLPVGEHIPYALTLLLTLIGNEALLDGLEYARAYGPGKEGELGMLRDGSLVGVRFCDEAMSPELYRLQALRGADILVNISSLSWFHGSPMVYEQMKRIAMVRAVENGRWFVQSGNMSPAFVLDDRGRVVAETAWGVSGALVADVVPKEEKTLYTQLGLLVLLVPLSIIAAHALFMRKRRDDKLST